jgi:hypothetical protein
MSDLGELVATNIVRGLFPPETTRTALLGGYPVEQLVTYRYERLGLLVGTRVGDAVVENNVSGANARLSDRLGERLTADMRARFDSPSAAAAGVTVDTVYITVRTWSP